MSPKTGRGYTAASDRLWATYASFYDSLLGSPLYNELVEQVVAALCLTSGGSRLDAGCGTGNLATAVGTSVQNIDTEAVDSSIAMLRVAARKAPSNTHFRKVVMVDKGPLFLQCFWKNPETKGDSLGPVEIAK